MYSSMGLSPELHNGYGIIKCIRDPFGSEFTLVCGTSIPRANLYEFIR